jgi:hypothetical protein
MMLADPTNHGNEPGNGPLRPGGVPGTPSSEDNRPSTWSHAAKAQLPELTLVRDLQGAQSKMHERGQLYLPKAPGEEVADYNSRLRRSLYFNAFSDAVDGLTGFVFSRDPKLGDDVPPKIVEHWENIDLAGTHGDVFARDLLQDGMTAGHAAILVEFPDTGGGQSAADEFVIRPYWVPIMKDNIVSWRTEIVNGVTMLAQVVLKECHFVANGTFGEKEQVRYRVLYREQGSTGVVVGWRLLEVTEDNKVMEIARGLYPTQDEIPIAEIRTSGRKALFESRPPLVDLAYVNVAHYQMWSDYATAIHKTNVPIFVTTGLPDTDEGGQKVRLVLGPNTALMIPDVQGDAKYVAHDGAALEQTKQALDDLKGDMATLGLSMLAVQKRTAETAEAKRIDEKATNSKLAVTARGLQDGLERALYFHARYLKLESGGSIEINRDFEELQLAPQEMAAYASLLAQGYPMRYVLAEMQRRGRIEATENIEDALDEIAANKAAEDQRKREEFEAAQAQALDEAA